MKNKLKQAMFCLIACAAYFQTKAQTLPITISARTNTNKSIEFTATKTDPGTYTLILNFNNVTNATAGREVVTVTGYSRSAYILDPINKDQGVGYSYGYSYIRGKLKVKHDPEFVYLLPYKNGTKVRAAESSFANATYFGSTTPEDWKAYRFFTKTEDTITAVRKGTVVEVTDQHETDDKKGIAFTNKLNSIIIEHADGTILRYQGLKKGSIVVKVGDVVFPGTSLGVNSKTHADSPPNVSLLFMYLKSADIEASRNTNVQNSKSLYGFITAKFCTTENPSMYVVPNQEYTVAVTPEIVQKEMSKKELKTLVKK